MSKTSEVWHFFESDEEISKLNLRKTIEKFFIIWENNKRLIKERTNEEWKEKHW